MSRLSRQPCELLILCRGRLRIIKALHRTSLNMLAHYAFNAPDQGLVLVRNEGEGSTGLRCSARATDAMRIGVGRVGHVIVDDMGNGRYIDVARCNVGRDEYLVCATPEPLKSGLAPVLRKIPLERRCFVYRIV